MTCTPAPTCKAALAEATRLWPDRSRLSDGICPRPEHTAANPTSDHELGNAWDLTHDPAHGCDAHALAERIRVRRDPRVKYLISNSRIAFSYVEDQHPAWEWRSYTGRNPHSTHLHVSIVGTSRNNTAPWFEDPATPEEAHMVITGIVATALVPGGSPDPHGRFPFWAVKADGSVFAFNGAPFFGPHSGLGTTAVIGIHPRTDRLGYVLVSAEADDTGGASTYAFPA